MLMLAFPAQLLMAAPQPYQDLEEDQLTQVVVQKFPKQEKYARLVVRYALWHERQNPGLKWPKAKDILAVVSVESGFNPEAVHPIGPSVGLMQINAGAHKVSVSELKQIGPNMKRGYELLVYLRAKTRSDAEALIAYNAGLGGMKSICKNSKKCVTTYVLKVSRAKQNFKG